MGVNILFEKDFEVVATIELEQVVTDAGILGIVIGKFRYWQQLGPIILLLIDKCFEVFFYCTVLSLGLAICLRVEGCK